jgi:hypothetical protein
MSWSAIVRHEVGFEAEGGFVEEEEEEEEQKRDCEKRVAAGMEREAR